VDPEAVKITGLTTEFLSDKPKFQEVAADFVAFLQEEEAELIIHNAPFDLGFLNYELGLINHTFSPIENYLNIIDTLVLARQMHPGQRNSLDALCKRYNVNNSNREYHGALLDANLLVEVYLAMTAGQTAMSFFSVETPVKEDKNKPFHVKKMTRANDLQLKVIRASEAEVQLHEARLAELQTKK
jgi:DNA polymerase-3 subunit epsilon